MQRLYQTSAINEPGEAVKLSEDHRVVATSRLLAVWMLKSWAPILSMCYGDSKNCSWQSIGKFNMKSSICRTSQLDSGAGAAKTVLRCLLFIRKSFVQ